MKNRIRQVRKEQGVSQEKLANSLGLTRQAISQYEIGNRKPNIETWQKLADFLGVSVAYLQGNTFGKSDVFEVISKEYVNPKNNFYWIETIDKHLEIVGMKPLKKTFNKEELKNFSENVKQFFEKNFAFVFLTSYKSRLYGVEKTSDIDTLIKKDNVRVLAPIMFGFSDSVQSVDNKLISTSISDLFDKGIKRKLGNFYLGSDTFVRTANKKDIIDKTNMLIDTLNKFVEDVSKVPENKATSPEKARKRLNNFINSGGKSFE